MEGVISVGLSRVERDKGVERDNPDWGDRGAIFKLSKYIVVKKNMYSVTHGRNGLPNRSRL